MKNKLRGAIKTVLEESFGRCRTLIVDDGSRSICTACGRGGKYALTFRHSPKCKQQAYWKAREILHAAIAPKPRRSA